MDDPLDGAEAVARRAAITADIVARTGISEDMIRQLVHTFYRRVRADAVLGPVFEARIEDWDTHLARMCAFWSSVALMTGCYRGQPMQKHASLPVDASHFDRWLQLFCTTAHEVCPPAAAYHFVERARMIAQSLEIGIATHRGFILPNGARLPEIGHVQGARYMTPHIGAAVDGDNANGPFASPPCLAHEIVPTYRGLANDRQQTTKVIPIMGCAAEPSSN